MHSYLWTAPPTPQKPGRYAFNPKSLRKTNPARVGHLAPFKNGRGFLHRCVELNHFALLDFLLSCDRARSGFDPNQKDKMGKTPIHLALSGQMHDFIKMLHKHGAGLEKLTNNLYTGGFRIGESVLFEAIAEDRFSTASFLLSEFNLSPRIVDSSGNNFLHSLLLKLPA